MSLLLVRHASAGNRDDWTDHDHERPLDARGLEQAAQLPEVLSRFPIERILSSPAKRCVQTVEPREELSEERRQADDGAALVRSLAGQNVLVCGHGGLESVIPGAPKWRKGTTFVVDDNLHVESIF